jgi:hypothetical protein
MDFVGGCEDELQNGADRVLALLFSITGTPSACACSTMKSWR